MLGAEMVTAATGLFLWSLQDEIFIAGGFPALIGYLVFGVLAVVLTVFLACVGSVGVVLPLHLFARWAVRRAGRQDRWWWCLAAIAAVAAVVALAVGVPVAATGGPALLGPLLWLGLVAALTPATLFARAAASRKRPGARWGIVGTAVAGGAALWVAVLGTGITAYATGLLELYEAPRLSATELAGTWTGGHGDTLRLSADGTAVAHVTDDHPPGRITDEPKECTGTGRWSKSLQGDGIELTIVPCNLYGLTFGGTQEKPTLYDWYGDPDSGDRYILTRQD
ncbi:hypothetical protein G5C51_22630 [Streptomyces sp. A7024]|uniref:Uncharacterized protein n=1 Tax=Streptomyces coryli TaxID=1128680 RepID=A0A6G4U5W1_9ACTN|nr:hypothetical protein [Streptomyces coryli]NGN66687.1 hypothetical protein [Streptomyces coryli]